MGKKSTISHAIFVFLGISLFLFIYLFIYSPFIAQFLTMFCRTVAGKHLLRYYSPGIQKAVLVIGPNRF